ncbi:MAG: hypothetical protein GQ536_06835 [Candidatus Aminicenantes bacterium]|nr:hypothetical protein [Candidatus Aminicenantes bacterium]
MAKCSKCKKRKGKRYCVALGDYLCSLCCGLLREKKIHCPQNCSFLTKHRPYQEKRIIEKKQTSVIKKTSSEEDILNDERMAWLAFHIEAPLHEFAEKRESFSDKEALLSLEYAREKIDKGKKLLSSPQEEIKQRNEIGEAIYQRIENCRYEKRIILPGEMGIYKREEKLKCLERVMLAVRSWAKGNFEGRNYIQQLITRFARIEDVSRQKKIIPRE